MNHHHRKILHSLFAHPINANISMKDVEHVLKDMGGEIKQSHSGKLHVALNGHSANFSHHGHSLPKEEVMQMRKFIVTCGIDPELDYPV
jgi:hypothetical protein